jgi:hypothetical protein
MFYELLVPLCPLRRKKKKKDGNEANGKITVKAQKGYLTFYTRKKEPLGLLYFKDRN